jgi:RHS repeat-associated protein
MLLAVSGTDPSFSYDAENHLTGWTDGVGTWARTFDDAGRITAESLGGNTRVSYMWDATGKKGLMLVGARYYDAQVGRFITRDTVLSEHPYLYCEHDPVNWVDPSGHISVPDWEYLAAGLAIAGVGTGVIIGLAAVTAAPVALVVGMGVFGVAAIGVGAFFIGDWIADRMGPGETYLPPPTEDEMRRYREDIYDRRYRGDIPMPRGGHWWRPPSIRRG